MLEDEAAESTPEETEEIIDRVPSAEELAQKSGIQRLHESEALVGSPLMTKEQTIQQHGVQGTLLAKIILPEESEGSRGKEVGIVDFGEFSEADAPAIYHVEGKPMNVFGKAQSRYGLVALNYTPVDHIRAYYPLHEGTTVFGRRPGHLSHDLGLDQTEPGNTAISRDHLTITVTLDGTISLRDHSTNGTGFVTGQLPDPN